MSENKPQGGAGASLGAHSKDSHQAGSQGAAAPAAGTMGQQGGSHGTGTQERRGESPSNGSPSGASRSGNSESGNWQQAGSELAGQAKEGMERVAHNVRDAAASARDTIATRGSQAMESTGQMVRDQPFMALAVTGIACFAIGMMIGRGRY